MNRSTDSAKISQAARGSIRLRTVCILFGLISAGILIWLLATAQQAQRLLRGGFAEDMATVTELLTRQQILTVIMLVVAILALLSVIFLILIPVRKYSSQIRGSEALSMRGAYEVRYLAEAYNLMVEETRKHNDSLRYMAEHDHLTGLLNRGAFDQLRKELEHDSIALLLIDVDKFKEVNDTYGHDAGDQVLRHVACQLALSFRASDYPCRIGGDEFAVIMTDMSPALEQAVLDKLDVVKEGLRNIGEGLPKVTLSVGVAFSKQCRPEDDIFKLADTALYRTKRGGRNGCAFYDPKIDTTVVER